MLDAIPTERPITPLLDSIDETEKLRELGAKTAKKHKSHVLDKALGIDDDEEDASPPAALPHATDSQEAPFDE